MIINKICIVGGGSSGWLTAAFLTQNLPSQVEISLIESTKIGVIGVGEGTQPATMKFLRHCGLGPDDWMKESNAVYKLGVEFVDWAEKSFFVDNDSADLPIVGPGLKTPQYFLSEPDIHVGDWTPSYKLAKSNKAPKLNNPLLDATMGRDELVNNAVHFDAVELGKTLKEKTISKLSQYWDDEIINIPTDENGITHLETAESGDIKADLYIDCTGFKSMLIEKTLGVEFHSLNDVLLCDSAVAIPMPYTNPEEECYPYTRSTTMDAGWMWNIPVAHRVGNGYVYSSKHKTPEEAEKELRDKLNYYEGEANHINMRIGIRDKLAYKNVYGVGLSAAFVEPLEATGITFTTQAIENLAYGLIQTDGIWNEDLKDYLTGSYHNMVQEIVDFIILHYHFCHREDTPFWQEVHNLELPETTKFVLDKFVPMPPPSLYEPGVYSMFHVGQWFELLHGLGAYKDVINNLDDDAKEYCKILLDTQMYQTEKLIEKLPNHYEYIKEHYENLQRTDKPKVKSETI